MLWAALGVVLLVVVWLASYFVRYAALLAAVLAAVAALVAVCMFFVAASKRQRLAVRALSVVIIVSEVVWLLSRWYFGWILASFGTIALALTLFAVAWSLRRRHATVMGWVARIGGGVGVVAAVLISALVMTNSLSATPLVTAVQSAGGFGNSFEPATESTRTVVQDNTLLINDLQYGTEYPNSYLDVYIADNDPTVARPTLIYVHGGGWVIGSKTMGDPNAGDAAFALGNGPVIDAGYNVVTLDYALAPEYIYPTPVIQLSQAVTFLTANAEEYGLDMSRVVLGGGSAGGHIAAQYAEIQTNPALAEDMGIAPTIEASAIKAIILDSAALDASRATFTQAEDQANDFTFGVAARAYFGNSSFLNASDPLVAQANIITHATADFPPAFIADGNYGTFPDQATDLASRLTELGVTNELNLVPLSDAELGHSYMSLAPSRYVDEYNAKKIAFLESVVT